MYKCEWCDKEFETYQHLGGHKTFCKLNPNIDHNYEMFKQNKEKIKQYNSSNVKYICQYCGKEIANKGCLVLHEKYCKENPNRIISKSQKLYEERNNRRDENGKIKFVGKPHSEESKKKISEARKKYLREHKDEHVWKRNNKFKSIPCENLKNYLKSLNIDFVEEYTPFDDINYSIDISWPDEKIGIEVNGNQHYNKDGDLSEYYQKRHDVFESRGWKIFEIHYSKCYKIDINNFNDILNLPIYDKEYVKSYFERKKKNVKINKEEKRKLYDNENKKILLDLIENSKIDFSKMGWSTEAREYLKNKNVTWYLKTFIYLRKYFPEFLKQENVWKRKSSIY